jgi:hypothetical protein
MSKSDRECTPEVLSEEQLEIVSGGAMFLPDPATAPRCGIHPPLPNSLERPRPLWG